MPTQSTKLKLPIPLGNEFHNRAAMVNFINELDSKVGVPNGLALLDENGKVIGVPEVKDASTTQKGIVQLDDSTDSTSTTKAATPNAVNKLKQLISNVANYAIATAAEAKAGVVNNKYMTPLRTKEAFDELAPPPIVLSPGTTMISEKSSTTGVSLNPGATSEELIRWRVPYGDGVKVQWILSASSTSTTANIYTWVEVNGIRQGEEKMRTTAGLRDFFFTQDVTVNKDDAITIRLRNATGSTLTFAIVESYITAMLVKFPREV